MSNLPMHYFDTGIISPDDDEHAARVADGTIPPKCRAAGPLLKLLAPVATPKGLTFCDLCPFEQRDLCGGRPKPAVNPLSEIVAAEDKKMKIDLSSTSASRMKRDVARGQLESELTKVEALRKRKTPI